MATLTLIGVLIGELQPRYCNAQVIGSNNEDVVSLIDREGRKH